MAVSGGNAAGQNEAFSLVAGNSGQMLEFLRAITSGLDEEDAIERAEQIIELPADEKFTGSSKFLSFVLQADDKDPSELEEDDIPEWLKQFYEQYNPEDLSAQLFELLESEVRRIRKQLHADLLNRPDDAEDYLILSVFLSEYESLLNFLGEVSPEDVENPDTVISTYGVLASHLILISTEERQEIYPELLRDMFGFPFYAPHERTKESDVDPESLSVEEMKIRLLVEGAADLYRNEEISVARGAELAGVRREVFEKALMERGIRPEYGPESVEELYDDVDL